MRGPKIEALNTAISEATKPMREVAEDNRPVRMLVRAVTFSSGARWHIEHPTPIEELVWPVVEAGGRHDMGHAFSLVANGLAASGLGPTGLRPFLVLVSDSPPTDSFPIGLSELMAQPWGKLAVRVAVAIGNQADLGVLQQFIGNSEIKPFHAKNTADLLNRIRWDEVDVLGRSNAPVADEGHDPIRAKDVF